MAIVKEITAFSKILKITLIFWTLSKVPPPPPDPQVIAST